MQAQKYERYGQYILDRSEELGRGSYGTVYKGYKINEDYGLTPVAIKEAYLNEQIMKEVGALQALDHQHIVKYYDYRQYKNYVLLFMDYCNDGSLDNLLIRCPSNTELIQIYSEILSGIKFMYSRKLLHRDIKPSNILVKNGMIKIADFGTSKFFTEQSNHQTLVGTPLFCSPQMLQIKMGQLNKYTEKSQIWSLGLVLYYMFNYAVEAPPEERTRLSLPWYNRDQRKLFESFHKEPLVFKNSNTPVEIREIIGKMLRANEEQRMSFQQLFSLQIFQKTPATPKTEKAVQTTIQRTIIGRMEIDDKLKDRLKEIQEEGLEDMQYAKTVREKALFCYHIYQQIRSNPELSFHLAKLIRDKLQEYISFSSAALTCNIIKDKELIKALEKWHPEIKNTHFGEDNLRQAIKAQLLKHYEFTSSLHSQSKLSQNDRSLLILLYDLLAAYTLPQHWKDQPRDLDEYYSRRKRVRNSTFIGRVKMAYSSLSIGPA